MIIKHKHYYGPKESANINVHFPSNVISYLFYQIRAWLRPDFSSKIQLGPASAGFEEAKCSANSNIGKTF